MKAIINGKRYDTERATLIGEADNLHNGASSTTDFQYWEAALYVTPRSKSYFLAGSGGPMSRFSRAISQNSWSGGEKLIPMERQDALEWAERYLDPAVVEKFFGDIIEDA